MNRPTAALRHLLAALAAGWALAGCAVFPPVPTSPMLGVQNLASREIDELSGLVKSRTHPGVFWAHNDSGDSPRIFAVSARGEVLGEFAVEGAESVDWEDIAIDDSGNLFLGDFGNNLNTRTDLRVYRVPEPDPRSKRRSIESDLVLPYRYADQNRRFDLAEFDYDAEALFHLDGALWIATKHRSDRETQLYRLPLAEASSEPALRPVARLALDESPVFGLDILGNVTGADLHPDGRRLALLTYDALFILTVERDSDVHAPPRFEIIRRIELDTRHTRQVEAIAWDEDELLLGNEGGFLFRIADPLAPGPRRYPPEPE